LSGGGAAALLDFGEGLDAAVVNAVIVGLVTMEEGECGRGGEAVEGVDHIVAEAAGGFDGGEFGVVDHGLHSGGAASAPGGRDHFLDEIQLDIVGGLKVLDVLVEILTEGLLFLCLQDDGGDQTSSGVLS